MDETPENVVSIDGKTKIDSPSVETPSNVIPLGGLTRLDLPPDKILETAMGKLDGVVIIGFVKGDKGGQVYAASSYADGGDVLWLLEACKNLMMNSIDFVDELDEE